MFNKKLKIAALAVGLIGSLAASQVHAIPVALELSLVIDVSGSIDATEYNTQMTGYKNAFLDSTVQANILGFASSGGIAVNVVQFGTNAAQVKVWTQLITAAQITQFANDLGSLARSGSVGTSTDVEDGIITSQGTFTNNFEGSRLVMDVSGDGYQNTDPICSSTPLSACPAVQAARDTAFAAGIQINGLAIEGDMGPNGVTNWYNTNVKTSNGNVYTATGFDTFELAVTNKIGKEVIGVPEPGSLALAGLGLLGLFGMRRRVKQA